MRSAKLEDKESLNLKEYLPHRFPLALIDKIVEISDKKVVGVKNVSLNEIYFRGHFPELPVMPGVLIMECIAQAAGAIMRRRIQDHRRNLVLVGCDRMRFRRPVFPGDQLILEVELVDWDGTQGKVKGVAKVAEQVAAIGDLTLALEMAR